MSIFKPPFKPDYSKPTVFIAGSIEGGTAEHWQERVGNELSKHFVVFNPRRDDWDSSWEESIRNPQFVGQVEWEIDALECASYYFFYFQPGTKSPISLLELGWRLGVLSHHSKHYFSVVCPEGFWKKGNVDILCRHYEVPVFTTLEGGVIALKKLANIKE